MKHEFAIDLKDVADAGALQDALAANLPLPPDYGCNLDAFYDVLTEYGSDWRIVFRNAGKVSALLRAVCRDAVAETPGLEIVFEKKRRTISRKRP